jgi:hypothetical protein
MIVLLLYFWNWEINTKCLVGLMHNLGSLPPGEHQVVMMVIMTKTKDINVVRVEQKTMLALSMDMNDKALTFYT